MTTYPHRIHVHRPHINGWLVTVVGLAAALIALGSWVLVDRYTGGGGATQDATTLIDNFNAAGSANDRKAAAALLTSNAVMWTNGTTITGAKAIANEIATTPGLHVERTAPVTVNGDFASTLVNFSALGGAIKGPMVNVFQLKDGKIFRMWLFALGVTPPFTNAVMP